VKLIPILILSIFLTGCSWFKKPDPPPAGISTKTVDIRPEALEYCSLLKEDLVIKTFDNLLVAYSDLALQYAECSNKQTASVKLLKQIGNIK
jgi:hypothetical protein